MCQTVNLWYSVYQKGPKGPMMDNEKLFKWYNNRWVPRVYIADHFFSFIQTDKGQSCCWYFGSLILDTLSASVLFLMCWVQLKTQTPDWVYSALKGHWKSMWNEKLWEKPGIMGNNTNSWLSISVSLHSTVKLEPELKSEFEIKPMLLFYCRHII